MYHHIMDAQNLFSHKGPADVDSSSIRKEQGIQGEFVLDDSPAIKDEALKRSLLGRRYMLLMNPA
jgi:hypothetical protein